MKPQLNGLTFNGPYLRFWETTLQKYKEALGELVWADFTQSTKKRAVVSCRIIEIFGEHWKGSYYADQIHDKNKCLEISAY